MLMRNFTYAATAILSISFASAASAGLVLEYDAANNPSDPNDWEDVETTGADIDLQGLTGDNDNAPNQTTVPRGPVTGSNTTFTQAYQFTGAADGHNTRFDSGFSGGWVPANEPGSFEVWVRPSSLQADNNKDVLLFKSGGGGKGFTLSLTREAGSFTGARFLNGGTAAAGTVDISASVFPGTDEFIQIVGVVDPDDTNSEKSRLYVNGVQVAADANQYDWRGGGGISVAGFTNFPLGGDDDGTVFQGLTGEIALARAYDNALSDADVLANYNASIPEPASLALVGMGGLLALSRKRRRVA